jgi:hypothetical protein
MKPLRMMRLAGNPEPLAPLTFTPPVWSYTEAIAICRKKNPAHPNGSGKGTARRDRLEIRLRKALAALDGIWGRGLDSVITSRDGSVRLGDLLHQYVKRLPPHLLLLRELAKARIGWLHENRPQRWARASIVPLDQRGPKSTPFQIPRRNEGAARAWINALWTLHGMLVNMASHWRRVVSPALRGVSQSSEQERGSMVVVGSRGVVVAESRDHVSIARGAAAAWLERARTRWCRPEVL